MPEEKHITAEVSFELTDEQFEKIKPLLNKRLNLGKGMIFGSVSIKPENIISLSYIPHELAVKIKDIAFEELGGKDVNS